MTRPTASTTSTTTGPATSAPAEAPDVVAVEPALVDGVDVDAIARAVRACAGVADLYSGRFGEIGSYLPGRRIGGVQVDDTSVTVHIRARWGFGVRDLLAQVSAVTVALRHGRHVNVVVDDIDDDLTTATSTVDAVSAVAPPRAIASAGPRPTRDHPPTSASESSSP